MAGRNHRTDLTALFVCLGLGFTAVGLGMLKSPPKGSASAKRIPKTESRVTVFASGRGTPFVNLTDGQPLTGAEAENGNRSGVEGTGRLSPVGLAQADFDLDGVPDLVSAHRSATGGVVKLHRGNVDALYPNTPEAEARKRAGTFTDEPFLTESVFQTPEIPDFVGAGDFNADGFADVAVAARNGSVMRLLTGNGKGMLALAETVEFPGGVTAFLVDDVNRRDGLADIVVGILGPDGAKVLVLQGLQGAFKAVPETFAQGAPPTGFAVGDLNLDGLPDLAITAGRELTVVSGRNRESVDSSVPKIEKRRFGDELLACAVGRFSNSETPSVAVLTADGAVDVLGAELERVQGSFRVQDFGSASPNPQIRLVATKTSALTTDDLLVFGPSNQIDLFNVSETLHASLSALHSPISVLPMRLNGDALSDLVVLQNDEQPISRLTTVPNVTITVNSAIDGAIALDGNLTLREAITAAVSNTASGDAPAGSVGLDTIAFSFGAGVTTISPTSALPIVSGTVTIDATTIPGQVVDLNGAGAGVGSNGLQIAGSGAVVRGLVIQQFNRAGILLNSASNVVVEGCRIGTNAAGTAAAANGINGITITNGATNTIGGSVAAARNLISGNTGHGIDITGATASGNRILGNFIGPDAAGTVDLGNTSNGVRASGAPGTIIGGVTAAPGTTAGNVLSGNNLHGIQVTTEASDGTLIQGNLIGTNAAGTAALGNTTNGVRIDTGADDTTLGGSTSTSRNVCSGNSQAGISFRDSATTGTIIQGNFVGTNISGTAALANARAGIENVSAGGGAVGGPTATPGTAPGNVVSGNSQEGILIQNETADNVTIRGNIVGLNAAGTAAVANGNNGVTVTGGADNATIGGPNVTHRNVISGNLSNGVSVSTSTTTGIVVQTNYVGTDITGILDLGNSGIGVVVSDAPAAVIGGSTPTPGTPPGNVVSGNNNNGIQVSGDTSDGAVIRGNIVGLNAAGTAALGNTLNGVDIQGSTDNTVVGGPTANDRNIVSANGSGMIVRDTGTTAATIQSNYVGTDITGAVDLGNTGQGIVIQATDTIIGGNAAMPGLPPGNVVSGNNQEAIRLSTDVADNTVIRGNMIGLNAAGTAALGNNGGIVLTGGPDTTTIGGTTTGDGNVISGNALDGIRIESTGTTGTTVQGNFIGTSNLGLTAFPNADNGIEMDNAATGGLIGGTTASAANVIAFNTGNGVQVRGGTTTGFAVLTNSIHSNGALGIDLFIGGNLNQAAPTITGVAAGIVSGTAPATGTGPFRIQVFGNATCDSSGSGEGRIFLGETTGVAAGGAFSVNVGAAGDCVVLTATATAADNNTSEFSLCNSTGDAVPPMITTCPAAQTVPADTDCLLPVPNFVPGVVAADNCTPTGSLTITQNPTAGTQVGAGTTPVTIIVRDFAGNTTTCPTSFTVTDPTPPVITTCPAAQTVSANATCQAPLPNFAAVTVATDNCTAQPSLQITQSPPPGTLVGLGTTNVTITVADSSNNQTTCMTSLTVNDTSPPAITTCPGAQTANADADCLLPIPNFVAGVVASDNCTPTGSLTITQNPTAGTEVGGGTTVVTITVRDQATNQTTCSVNFTVLDSTAPVITTCPAAQTLSANASCQAQVPNFVSGVVASDNCSPVANLTITQNPTAGTLIGLGTTNVTITVRDLANNSTTCQTSVTVNDTTAPTITTCPAAQTANADADCLLPIPNFVAGVVANDNCTPTGSLTITQNPTAGTQVGDGVTNVTITVTDAANNQTTCQTTYTVNDVTPPQISTCPAAQTVSADAGCLARIPNFVAGVIASDNCTATGTLTITQNPLAGTQVGLGTTNVTITVTDEANNSTTCQTSLTVNDTTAPTIMTCPAAQTANADADCLLPIPNFVAGVVAFDNCTPTGTLTITQNPLAGTQVGLGTTAVTITVTDAVNNSSTCMTSFTVVDVTPPVITFCPPNQTANATGPTGAVVTYPPATATDNCTASPTITYSQNSGTVFPIGTTIVTVTATDASNNSSTCTFTVTINAVELSILYAADTQNHRVQKFDGNVWTVLAGTGVPGIAPNQCNLPEAVAASIDGLKIYVADTGNNRITFSTNGGATWAVFASSGIALNQVKGPQGLALDTAGNLYVSDTVNRRVLRFNGGVPGTAALLANDGIGSGQVKSPRGLAADTAGNLFVADKDNHRILRIAGAAATGLNTGTVMANGPGFGLTQVNGPEGLAVDNASNLYVADTENNRVMVFAGGAGAGTVLTNGLGAGLGFVNRPEGVTVSRFILGPLTGQSFLIVSDTGGNRIEGRPLAAPTWQLIGAPNGIGSFVGQFRSPSKIR